MVNVRYAGTPQMVVGAGVAEDAGGNGQRGVGLTVNMRKSQGEWPAVPFGLLVPETLALEILTCRKCHIYPQIGRSEASSKGNSISAASAPANTPRTPPRPVLPKTPGKPQMLVLLSLVCGHHRDECSPCFRGNDERFAIAVFAVANTDHPPGWGDPDLDALTTVRTAGLSFVPRGTG